MKKSIIILGILIIAGAGGYFAWTYIKNTRNHEGTNITAGNGAHSGATTTPASSFKPLGDTELADYFVSGNKIIGLARDGAVSEISASGQNRIISQSKINNLIRGSFSFDGQKILAEYGSPSEVSFSIFDLQSLSWAPLGNFKITAAAWSPDSHDLAYLESINGQSNLGIMKTDTLADVKKPELGFKRQTLASLNEIDSELSWTSRGEVMISSRPTKFAEGYVLKFKIDQKIFETVAYRENGVIINWAPDGERGLKFSATYNNLSLIDKEGRVLKILNLKTLPQKCAWSQAYLYCALPKEFPAGVNLPDDYYQKSFFTNDSFYRINLDDGSVKNINSGDDSKLIDATGIKLDHNHFFFLNRGDGKLYQLY